MKFTGKFLGYLLCIFFVPAAGGVGPTPAPFAIVNPVLDTGGHPVEAVAPNGKTYPVFRRTPESPLVAALRSVLGSGQAQQELELERYARTLAAGEVGSRNAAALAPMYLLLSTEEGGYARWGFWMEGANGHRDLIMAGYVDMVVDQSSIGTGGFEEIFCHELGHLILRSLLGDLSHGPSRKMHQGMTVTDYPTAFDEGYAEHFQPLVRDSTTNSILRKIQAGTGPMDMDLLWISNFDGQLRSDGVKRNLFVHRKAPPHTDPSEDSDRYQAFVREETSGQFLPGVFKNAQEMMASEGVISTLFYRLVNRESLRNHYREAAFYRQFLQASVDPTAGAQSVVSPYANINLKLFAAMRQIANRSGDPGCPLAIALLNAYAKLFPDEAKSAYGVFLDTTYGVTASPEVASRFERASTAGHLGDLESYRENSHAAFTLLDQITDRVAKGELALDANLGPEIWLLNDDFKIARAVWEKQRTLPLSFNLNAASEAELMTLPGVDLQLAKRLTATRHSRGYYRSLDEMGSVEGVSPALLTVMKTMAERMKAAGMYTRQ